MTTLRPDEHVVLEVDGNPQINTIKFTCAPADLPLNAESIMASDGLLFSTEHTG